MPIEPDELNKRGKKVDITRLLQQLNLINYAKGKIPTVTQEDWNNLSNLARHQKAYKGFKASGGVVLSPYGEWVSSDPSQRSPVGKFLYPNKFKANTGETMKDTWYGATGMYKDKYVVPLILDRMARDIAAKRVSPLETISAIYKNRGRIKATQETPDGKKKINYVGGLGLPLFRAVRDNTELKWKPLPPRFVPDGNPTNQTRIKPLKSKSTVS